MDWTQVYVIIGVIAAISGVAITIQLWVMNKIDTDVKGLSSRIDSAVKRLDGHAQRIDQLYGTIIEMLKK